MTCRIAAAAMLQAAERGRRGRIRAVSLALLPADPRVVLHAVTIDDDELLSSFQQVSTPPQVFFTTCSHLYFNPRVVVHALTIGDHELLSRF